jgi:hypothetical protein
VIAAPDYIEPVEGWRIWLVDSRIRLRSVFFEAPWVPGKPLDAACLRWRRSLRPPWRIVPSAHPAPEDRCVCGIYAAASRADAQRYAVHPLPAATLCRVIGRVALWGEVVECETGWRASSAYPVRLYVPSTMPATLRADPFAPDAAEIAAGLAKYGVPVEVVDALEAEPRPAGTRTR